MVAPHLEPASESPSAIELDRLQKLKILIVADHASARFGGEAALPLHYFRVMRQMGMDVRMLTHDRVKAELAQTVGSDRDRIIFIADNWAHKLLWKMGKPLPARVSYFTTGFLSRTITQVLQRRIARRLVQAHALDFVLQPMPVSPREPSLMYGVGAPVVIGPLNGNMHYPPGFRNASAWRGRVEGLARIFGLALNLLFPGKRRAAVIFVANERTRQALPDGLEGQVLVIPENGVDLAVWRKPTAPARVDAAAAVKFVFMGRLVDWKAVDLLLHAFSQARSRIPVTLTILGDGPCGEAWRELARQLGILGQSAQEPGKVFFAGWQTQLQCASHLQHSDVLVLPSLSECGGAVVLEAMACGLPVIATAWGGPLDYLNDLTGILVPPTSRDALTQGLASAIIRLSESPELRESMGKAARRRVETDFDWDKKVIEVLSVLDGLRAA